jgi:hypothetical protein
MSRKLTVQDAADDVDIEGFRVRFPDEVRILNQLWQMDQVDPLKLVANLIAVMADSERAEKHVKAFQAEKEKADRAKVALVEARAKHDQHIADSTAELDRSRASLRRREVEIEQRQGSLAAREERAGARAGGHAPHWPA